MRYLRYQNGNILTTYYSPQIKKRGINQMVDTPNKHIYTKNLFYTQAAIA